MERIRLQKYLILPNNLELLFKSLQIDPVQGTSLGTGSYTGAQSGQSDKSYESWFRQKEIFQSLSLPSLITVKLYS